MSEDRSEARLSQGAFKRKQLARLEKLDIRNTFGDYQWVEVQPRRWLATGTSRLVAGDAAVIGDGKEATVYRCPLEPETGIAFAAAKIYRAQKFRAFSKAAHYRQGAIVRDKRTARAIEKRTKRGRELAHGMWISGEWETINRLWDAGADVPEPFAHSTDGILMEYLGEEDAPAPQLLRVHLEGIELRRAFEDCVRNLEIFLACDRIHGDLSAYNILWWQDRIRIIDLPQATEASNNPDALVMLDRDVRNLGRYFERSGLSVDATAIATDLWQRWLRGKL